MCLLNISLKSLSNYHSWLLQIATNKQLAVTAFNDLKTQAEFSSMLEDK